MGRGGVSAPYDRAADERPQDQIEQAERSLYELAETGRYGGGFQRFAQALTTAVEMAAHAYQRDGKLSGLATGLKDLDRMMGGLQKSDLIILAGRPGMGEGIARGQHRLQRGEGRGGQRSRRRPNRVDKRRHCRLFLARDVR